MRQSRKSKLLSTLLLMLFFIFIGFAIFVISHVYSEPFQNSLAARAERVMVERDLLKMIPGYRSCGVVQEDSENGMRVMVNYLPGAGELPHWSPRPLTEYELKKGDIVICIVYQDKTTEWKNAVIPSEYCREAIVLAP